MTPSILHKKKIISRPKRSISMSFIGDNNKITNYELIQLYHNEIKKLPYIIIDKNKS